MNNKQPLKCPYCEKELLQGEKQRYEMLAEHVCDPNRENYPLRETWVCTCEESKDSFWDSWGDLYGGSFKCSEGFTSAINSGARECDEEFEKRSQPTQFYIGNRR